MARGEGKETQGEDTADEFDIAQFENLARLPEVVRAFQQIAAEHGRTFEEEMQLVLDLMREKKGVSRKGPPAPPDHWTNKVRKEFGLPSKPRPH